MNRSLAFVFAALTTTAIAGENFLVYFGTNTNAKNGRKGIYVARFNSASGELTQPELAVEAGVEVLGDRDAESERRRSTR